MTFLKAIGMRLVWIISVCVSGAAVVKNPSNNLWIIAAVLAPIGVVTIIIIIITAVLCHKNKSDFKTDAIGNLNPRVKVNFVKGADISLQIIPQIGHPET